MKYLFSRLISVGCLLFVASFSLQAKNTPPSNINPYLNSSNVSQHAYDPFSASKKTAGAKHRAETGNTFYIKLAEDAGLDNADSNNKAKSKSATSSSSKSNKLSDIRDVTATKLEDILSHNNFTLRGVYPEISSSLFAATYNSSAKTNTATKSTASRNNWFKLQLGEQELSNTDLLKQISSLPEVEYVEQEVLFSLNPNEQSHSSTASDQTNSNNMSAKQAEYALSEQWYLERVHATEAWQHMIDNDLPAGGSPDVIVAVIDTGIDYQHEDLLNNLWKNPKEIANNGIDDDKNGIIDDIYGASFVGDTATGDPKDDNGHGTHVSGIIAAEGDNGLGIKGIAHNVKVMSLKAGQYSGILTSGAIVQAIDYAATHGADVINMSFGGGTYSKLVEDALANAYSTAVLVASAGNNKKSNDPYCDPDGYQRNYPASFNWVIGVMAQGQTPTAYGEEVAGFSNWECVASDGFEYEVMAPGTNILSTIPNNGYARWDGTSMAAPVVSALAALARSQWPDKDSYSSRFISGQLVATGDDKLGKIDRFGDGHYYKDLNGEQVLSSTPIPSLSYHSHWLFDNSELDTLNDNDGRADSGELINLGIVLHNQWGKASNVNVTLLANTPTGDPSPYIEMLTDTVNYGDVASFSNEDNGLLSQEGEITGVRLPFQFRVRPDAPNNMVIPFTLRITANNGFDEDDLNEYVFQGFGSDFSLQIQRGYEFPIFITEDMTLTKDKLWIINQPALIESGVTLTVEAGTQIQFFSSNESSNQQDSLPAKLSVRGKLNIQGSASEPVELFPSELKPAHRVKIEALEGGTISMDYVKVMNPYFEKLGGNFDVKHGYLTQYAFDGVLEHFAPLDKFLWATPLLELDSLSHSKLTWLGNSKNTILGYYFDIDAKTISHSLIESSNINSFVYSTLSSSVLLNNVRTADGLLPMNTSVPGDIYASDMHSIGYSYHENAALLAINPQQYGNANYALLSGKGVKGSSLSDEGLFNWYQDYATYLGGSIAIVEDEQELDQLAQYLEDSGNLATIFDNYDCGLQGCSEYFSSLYSAYIGLTDFDGDGQYLWVDGSELSYQPDYFNNNDNDPYVTMTGQSWNDVPYIVSYSFVLEFPADYDVSQLNQRRREYIAETSTNNAFLNRWWDESAHWQVISSKDNYRDEHEWFRSFAGNYWGTSNVELIENAISDFYDGKFEEEKIVYEPILSQANNDTYPFVTDIQLSTSLAQNTTDIGSELVTFTLSFNRDMNMTQSPRVSFGPAMPMTDYAVSGNWQDMRTWVGSFQITPFTGDGYQYIRVTEAVAADDAWLVTGNDGGRFRFNITTNTTESMQMQASSEPGYILLNWYVEQSALLHGINIYRAEGVDGNYVRIVQSLLESAETSYKDYSVEEGKEYSYKITLVYDGQESELSESVSSTAQAPAGNISVAQGSYSVAENAGSMDITMQRTNGDNGELRVEYQSADLSAVAGTDYTAVFGSVSFANGEMSKTISIDITDNTVWNEDKSFNFTISGDTVTTPNSVTVTITDNEPAPAPAVVASESKSSSGGGSISWVGLLFLLGLFSNKKRPNPRYA